MDVTDPEPPIQLQALLSRPGAAMDTGGSLVKIAYAEHNSGWCLRFARFPVTQMDQAIAFIKAQAPEGQPCTCVKATGGGAHLFSDRIHQQLGVTPDKKDEMACLGHGCSFLLRAVQDEAFTYRNSGTGKQFIHMDGSALYPYLLVNVGTGVSVVKVSSEDQFERVGGSHIGGGTFLGLCQLITDLDSFDDIMTAMEGGHPDKADMLVGDIYGCEYAGLAADIVASSMANATSKVNKPSRADKIMALCRMVAYHVGHLGHMAAQECDIQRVFFSGGFIRGIPYVMEMISEGLEFWSKGAVPAMFLQHEGFLGAVGAFLLMDPEVPGHEEGATAAQVDGAEGAAEP